MSENRKRSVGKRCVAYGCSTKYGDGFALHLFPTNADLCKMWTNFVQKKRDKWDGPTTYSALCEKHFEDGSYPMKYAILRSMGQTPPKKKVLNADAIPTIQTAVQAEPMDDVSQLASPLFASTPKPKKPRSAFMKRQNRRIINEILIDGQTKDISGEEPMDTDQDDTTPTVLETPTVQNGSCISISTTRTCGTQLAFKKPCARTVRVQVTPLTKEKGCQTTNKPKMKNVEVQCNILKPAKDKLNTSVTSDELDQSWISSAHGNEADDSDYQPSECESDVGSECLNDDDRTRKEDRLYLVSEQSLMSLFQVCPQCSSPSLGNIINNVGTLIKVEQDCGVCGHSRLWNSQPLVGSIPLGNLKLSCGILFSGSLPAKTLRIFDFMNCPAISKETFIKHQRNYLQPAIVDLWKERQRMYLEEIQRNNRPICIGGDGRCDTPGHSAKFGSYSVMDLDQGQVIDVQLVQSNEVKSSCHMEKEGLSRSIAFLQDHDIDIHTIVTDRHVQIRKWVRENMTDTKHCVDVWHVAKGLKKKVLALSKEKDCGELSTWIRSITNHLYWVAASTPDADKDLMMEKWQSLGNHIQNIHEGHGKKFPKCLHPDLTGLERRKRWLKPGTKSLEKLLPILDNRQMKMDIPMLSTNQQTSELEGYHSVINHFAPKMHGFSYYGMVCRLLLGALHYNENGGRDPAVTKDGNTCYNIVYPKHKKGEYTVREVKMEPTFDYVQELLQITVNKATNTRMTKTQDVLMDAPPALCSTFERPSKLEAVSSVQSRFA
ncbi:uncharacterized protein LOC132563537 [Ylistrum balloti]|uniref:uncharacterized protein LOC132563537 n=3 Tax=Ylistrum balloti TaxID=509963 RepID=UPI00290581C4|nr:uncharacterized protein LOC132563537 [Ylistrum balloti]